MSSRKKTIRDIDVRGKRVLARVDFNVPQSAYGEITDDTRIVASLPTILHLVDAGARVILVSHLGRPEGVTPGLSLLPIADRLSELLGKEVALLPGTIGAEVEARVFAMKDGDVVLLENVRFHPEEEENDPEFARKLASLAEIFVNDAFGAAHRAHASTEGVAQHIPGVAGLLMEKELEYLGSALTDPKRPFVAILGGVKVKDKIGVIRNLAPKVDKLIIGGAMAYTFLKAQGHEIGKSLLDARNLDFCKEMLETYGGKILLPVDLVVSSANPFVVGEAACTTEIVPISGIPEEWEGCDIGPQTRAKFAEAISSAATVVWNGPMGIFEFPKFAAGTRAVAEALATSNATTIIGGGDSAAAVAKLGFGGRMTHVSTGGGASLKFMEGKPFKPVEALQNK